MAIGGVIVPGPSDYLPQTGGTINGALTVTGGITGNVTDDVTGKASSAADADRAAEADHATSADHATNADKLNGCSIQLEHNTSDTWILVFSGDKINYVLKNDITQGLENNLNSCIRRIADCEQKITAIGRTTEVLVRTAVSNSAIYDSFYNNVNQG